MDKEIYKLNMNTVAECCVFDDSTAYKTDLLVKKTRYLSGTDSVLSKIAEAIRLNVEDIKLLAGVGNSYAAEIGEHTFFFKLGKDTGLNLNDVVFYKYSGREAHRNDRRFLGLIKHGFEISVHRSKDNSGTFKKLYSLSGTDGVNFPLLNDSQLKIVTAEEGNVLVQGVAGSGKTNVCIDRIIYSACRNYGGRVLYSTYSRGLLIETENKMNAFIKLLKTFNNLLAQGKVSIYGNAKRAIESRLGIGLTADGLKGIIDELNGIIGFLENKVDYFLIADVYRSITKKQFSLADEDYFLKVYAKNLKNYRLTAALEKLKNLEYEIIYKEIFGMISGLMDGIPSLSYYTESRANSFSRAECETIYGIALDYLKFMEQNAYADNNTLSRELIDVLDQKQFPADFNLLGCEYSLAVLDEVQDFTQINLALFRRLATKLFCVGDALQMINPSYFSFAFLKRLMYEKDVTAVKELTHNYRNTAKLNGIIEKLNDINTERFGTHSFVLHGESVDSDVSTAALYTDGNFLSSIEPLDLSNCTLVVSGAKRKDELRTRFPAPEILTVSEIKGLERDTIVLIDLLSDNSEKWEKLYRDAVNRKTADENSAYRYWFNLLYVGISRARRNLFVSERKDVKLFSDFFRQNFDAKYANAAATELQYLIGKGQLDELEIYARIDEFISLEQYDNALFAAKSLSDEDELAQRTRIRIYADLVHNGKYREAGVSFWENGLTAEAKKYFDLSGNSNLSALVDACSGEDGAHLDASIAQFYPDLADNETARRLIIDTVNKDLSAITERQKDISKKIKALKALKR